MSFRFSVLCRSSADANGYVGETGYRPPSGRKVDLAVGDVRAESVLRLECRSHCAAGRRAKMGYEIMSSQEKGIPATQQIADLVADELNADVILYSGPIERDIDRMLIDACVTRRRRDNVLLMLVTMGGDPHTAYRIARCFQDNYNRFILYVSGFCKSAGTLVALGAHELIFSDHGELGPLDVQMTKKDEIWETQSGLTVMDTLTALKDNAFEAFEKFFLDVMRRSGGAISAKTAAQIATEMATGMFAPLYGQVDPLHIGEAARAMSIAGHYGRRLLEIGGNVDPATLGVIMSAYPSHGFVIDCQEAQSLFQNVKRPSEGAILLAESLADQARWPSHWRFGDPPPFGFLSTHATESEDVTAKEEGEENGSEHGGLTGSGLGGSAQDSREKSAGSNGDGEALSTPEFASENGDVQVVD